MVWFRSPLQRFGRDRGGELGAVRFVNPGRTDGRLDEEVAALHAEGEAAGSDSARRTADEPSPYYRDDDGRIHVLL